MKLLQIRINYNGNGRQFYSVFCAGLQRYLAERYFYRWTVARGWQNGRHYLLTFDTGAPCYEPGWRDEILAMANDFLASHPSPAYDVGEYVAIQVALSRVEGEQIDTSHVEANNTCISSEIDTGTWARKFENLKQRWSIFDAEVRLRPWLIRQWCEGEDHERFLYRLLILLGCTLRPGPSDNPDVVEYNGFLSYNANFLFWYYQLAPEQQACVTEQFEARYTQAEMRYLACIDELEAELAVPYSSAAQLAGLLVECYLQFGALAQQELIHQRSPYPKDAVAPRSKLSQFHQRLFYHDNDDSLRELSWEFSGYRWLLNIVYRNLPGLDVSPLSRQYCNFSIDRLQREHLPWMHRIRKAMLSANMAAVPM